MRKGQCGIARRGETPFMLEETKQKFNGMFRVIPDCDLIIQYSVVVFFACARSPDLSRSITE